MNAYEVILSNEDLLAMANYRPSGCLCGHGESCWVCSRPESTRILEKRAKFAALELLQRRGVKLHEEERKGYANLPYTVYSIEK